MDGTGAGGSFRVGWIQSTCLHIHSPVLKFSIVIHYDRQQTRKVLAGHLKTFAQVNIFSYYIVVLEFQSDLII